MKIYKSPRELITVLLLIISALAFLMYTITNNQMKAKYTSLKNNAITFSNAVSTNIYNFRNEKIVFLDEVVNEDYISNIKSPFSSGFCDGKNSFVQTDSEGRRFVTLTCDNYMLYNYDLKSDNFVILKISDWDTKKSSNSEKKELYNCISLDSSKNIYDDYYEEKFFLYRINSDYGTNYSIVEDIDSNICTVDKKIFYRTETEIDVEK